MKEVNPSQHNNKVITLTEAAIDHIKAIIQRRGDGVGFRISVKKTGCSGYMYVPEIIDTIQTSDLLFKVDDLTVLIDPDSIDFIRGTQLDYVQKKLGQQQLVFNNPNVDSLCGCGESFNLKEDDVIG